MPHDNTYLLGALAKLQTATDGLERIIIRDLPVIDISPPTASTDTELILRKLDSLQSTFDDLRIEVRDLKKDMNVQMSEMNEEVQRVKKRVGRLVLEVDGVKQKQEIYDEVSIEVLKQLKKIQEFMYLHQPTPEVIYEHPIVSVLIGEWKSEEINGQKSRFPEYLKYKKHGGFLMEYEKDAVSEYNSPVGIEISAALIDNHIRTPNERHVPYRFVRWIDRFSPDGNSLHVVRQLNNSSQYCVYRRVEPKKNTSSNSLRNSN